MSQRPQPKTVTGMEQKKPMKLVFQISLTGVDNVNVRGGI